LISSIPSSILVKVITISAWTDYYTLLLTPASPASNGDVQKEEPPLLSDQLEWEALHLFPTLKNWGIIVFWGKWLYTALIQQTKMHVMLIFIELSVGEGQLITLSDGLKERKCRQRFGLN
jgi:hypothetical protein